MSTVRRAKSFSTGGSPVQLPVDYAAFGVWLEARGNRKIYFSDSPDVTAETGTQMFSEPVMLPLHRPSSLWFISSDGDADDPVLHWAVM